MWSNDSVYEVYICVVCLVRQWPTDGWCLLVVSIIQQCLVSFSSVHFETQGPNSTKCNVLFFAVLGKPKGLVGFYGLGYVQTIQYLSKFFISDKYHLDFVQWKDNLCSVWFWKLDRIGRSYRSDHDSLKKPSLRFETTIFSSHILFLFCHIFKIRILVVRINKYDHLNNRSFGFYQFQFT